MSKFQVGDHVRCIDSSNGDEYGREYTVESIDDASQCIVLDDPGSRKRGGSWETRFELVKPENSIVELRAKLVQLEDERDDLLKKLERAGEQPWFIGDVVRNNAIIRSRIQQDLTEAGAVQIGRPSEFTAGYNSALRWVMTKVVEDAQTAVLGETTGGALTQQGADVYDNVGSPWRNAT